MSRSRWLWLSSVASSLGASRGRRSSRTGRAATSGTGRPRTACRTASSTSGTGGVFWEPPPAPLCCTHRADVRPLPHGLHQVQLVHGQPVAAQHPRQHRVRELVEAPRPHHRLQEHFWHQHQERSGTSTHPNPLLHTIPHPSTPIPSTIPYSSLSILPLNTIWSLFSASHPKLTALLPRAVSPFAPHALRCPHFGFPRGRTAVQLSMKARQCCWRSACP